MGSHPPLAKKVNLSEECVESYCQCDFEVENCNVGEK